MAAKFSLNSSHKKKPFIWYNLSMEKIHLRKKIPEEASNKRLDQALALMFPDYSRSLLQNWIREGYVKLDGKSCLIPKEKIQEGQLIEIDAKLQEKSEWEAQPISIDIVYEDKAIIVINKPAGLIVHPGAGKPDNTLVNALLHHAPELNHLPRAGLIHRLDKDTTGLLIIARSLEAHTNLVKALQNREIHREYDAIIQGKIIAGGKIETEIGRHPVHRTRMSVVDKGKPAITHYRVTERFCQHTRVQVMLETGRTHQIRVHFAHIHHPIVGDPVYGKRFTPSKKLSFTLQKALQEFKRQALHAKRLSLYHPISGKEISFEAPLPKDMKNLLEKLREDMKDEQA